MYKILVLTNKLSFDISDDFTKAFTYFNARLPFPFSVEYKEVNVPVGIKPYKQLQGFNPITGKPEPIYFYGLVDSVKDTCKTLVQPNTYDCVIFAWNMDVLQRPTDGAVTSFTQYVPLFNGTEFIQLAINPYLDNKGDLWKHISHELMHAFCYKISRSTNIAVDEMDTTKAGQAFYKNDDPYAPDGNYALTFKNLTPYFDKLNSQSPYQYFSSLEVTTWKLVPELWQILDVSRGLAGVPFRITSGLRTAEQNQMVGGKPNSAHLRGLAVDLMCMDNAKRTAMLRGILSSPKPVFIEIAKSHIHVDIDSSIHNLGDTIICATDD